MKPDYRRQIDRSRLLRKYGVRTGDRRVYWVSYPGMDGEVCREVYLSAKQAYERTDEIVRQLARAARLAEEARDNELP